MGTVTHLADYRARNAQAAITQDRLSAAARYREGMAKLAQEYGLGWTHTCPECLINYQPVAVTTPHGEWCPYCGAPEPTTPPEAA